MRKYKIAALVGIIVMGTGSFMACLCTAKAPVMIGNVLLIISLFIMTYAFSSWQPWPGTEESGRTDIRGLRPCGQLLNTVSVRPFLWFAEPDCFCCASECGSVRDSFMWNGTRLFWGGACDSFWDLRNRTVFLRQQFAVDCYEKIIVTWQKYYL